jgi:hypothetical protein
MRLDQDFNILIERHEKAQKAFHGKLPELSAQHFRNIGLADAKETSRFNLLQAALSYERVDLENKLCLDEVLVRILRAQILEQGPTGGFASFFGHGSP